MKNKMYWLFAILAISVLAITYGFTKPDAAKDKPEAMDCTETAKTSGESQFKPTIENKNTPPINKTPKGMVWIPGGEFSMGSNVEDESLCSIKGVTKDAKDPFTVFM